MSKSPIPTRTRIVGEKGQRSPTQDSPEERRDRKKSFLSRDERHLPKIFEHLNCEEEEFSSDSGVPVWQAEVGINKYTSTCNTKSVFMTMSDISNFSALLRNAFLDPETATAMRTVFKPLLDEQTQTIKAEIQEIKEDHSKQEQRHNRLEMKVSNLEEENTILRKTVEQHQLFLESVDYDRRQHSLIITGLSESETLKLGPDMDALITDDEKVDYISTKIGHPDTAVASIQRLNERRRSAWPRPLKITLHDATDRKDILRATNKLKTAGEQLSKVYVKKDTHPGIRREMKRLRDTEKHEKGKPENAGRSIIYDWKRRVVTVDGVVVDTYRPSFF